jgi:hypothetical protein
MKLCLLVWHKGTGVNTGWAKSRYTVIILYTVDLLLANLVCLVTEVAKMTSGQVRKEVKQQYREKFIIRNVVIHAIHRTGAAGRRNASSIPGGHGVESRFLSDQTGCEINSASCRVHNDAAAHG